MIESSQIKEHMEVLSSDGKHVGRVDHVRGSEIEVRPRSTCRPWASTT